MRAFGYVRISKLDEETTSPQRQREAVKKLCADRGWDLIRVFQDIDASAWNGRRRPGFDQMMDRLDEVEAVVFWRLDRLSRSVVQTSQIVERCQEAGVKLVSTDHQIDTTSASGKAFVQMSSVFAELESGTLSERARQMHAHLREHGVHVGRVPYGWRKVDGHLEPVPGEQDVLVEAARRYVAGESLRSISEDLGFHHPNLAQRLRSDRVIDALPAEVAGPLVQAMAERGRTGSRAKRSLLGGIARCAVCGGGMTVVGGRKRNGERVPHSSYACRERGHVSISRPWLDTHVGREVVAAIDTGQLVRRIKTRSRRRKGVPSREIEARLELLERDFYDRGMLPRDRFLRRRETLMAQLARAKEVEEEAGVDLPVDLAANLEARWNDLSPRARRRIISAALEKVEVARASHHGRIDPKRVKLRWRV